MNNLPAEINMFIIMQGHVIIMFIIKERFVLVSSFYGISAFLGYLMSKLTL